MYSVISSLICLLYIFCCTDVGFCRTVFSLPYVTDRFVYHLVLPCSMPPVSDHETVGCVVVDSAGHTSCATSTGGITAKMPGRVGDTPCVGAGGYADDEVILVLSFCMFMDDEVSWRKMYILYRTAL